MPRETRVKVSCTYCQRWECGKGETEYEAEVVLERQGWTVTEPIMCAKCKRQRGRDGT